MQMRLQHGRIRLYTLGADRNNNCFIYHTYCSYLPPTFNPQNPVTHYITYTPLYPNAIRQVPSIMVCFKAGEQVYVGVYKSTHYLYRYLITSQLERGIAI